MKAKLSTDDEHEQRKQETRKLVVLFPVWAQKCRKSLHRITTCIFDPNSQSGSLGGLGLACNHSGTSREVTLLGKGNNAQGLAAGGHSLWLYGKPLDSFISCFADYHWTVWQSTLLHLKFTFI